MCRHIKIIIALITLLSSNVMAEDAVKDFIKLRDDFVTKFKPLFIESATAWWEANTTGKEEAFKRKEKAEGALADLKSDKMFFAKITGCKKCGKIADPTLARELDVMYRMCVPNQADPALQKKIIAMETEVEQIFNTHRSKVDGKELTENDVRKIVGESTDSSAVEKAWKGYMEVGAKVESRLKQLVAMRNEMARSLGYKNYYVMRLSLDEISEQQLLSLFDELDALTREPFAQIKKDIDTSRAARFNLKPTELRPWHFGDLFFQEAPAGGGGGVNLDDIYKEQDLLALAREYYGGLGMGIDDIIARSDLYEKPGKSPHAFSTNLNRGDDVRVLCNMKTNLFWADTSLHELGHAVYDKYISTDVPFLLHEPAHSLLTEGYAMMMGAMAKNEDYLTKAVKLPPDKAAEAAKAARKHLRTEKLIFSRWAQVMVRFEYAMYSNPEQDLGKLWWSLKQKYQMLNPPDDVSRPDYGAKIHVVLNPAYYHSYMMGDLFACQLQAKMAMTLAGGIDPTTTCFWNDKKAGDYLRKNVFGPGNLYSWNDLIERATGEKLTAKYFAAQYVK
ncbi:MAG: M2 family metallopeptidase [Planctomycetes bacterium]|nr:M2 family metallopeptidase [Planctomycetota bacterium]